MQSTDSNRFFPYYNSATNYLALYTILNDEETKPAEVIFNNYNQRIHLKFGTEGNKDYDILTTRTVIYWNGSGT